MKIKYFKETVLTRELFEIDETNLPVVDQLFDHTGNKGSELVDMLQAYNSNLEPKKTKPARPKLSAVSTAIKLSAEHQKQQDELFKPDFTPNGDGKWNEAIAYVKTEWESIKYCIVNGLPLYIIGAVQLGKTIIYNAIAYLALKGFTKDDDTEELPLVELVLITTNNLTSSGLQNRNRSKTYLNNTTNGITVHEIRLIESIGDVILPGAVVQSLTNAHQLKKVKSLIERSVIHDKDHKNQIGTEFSPWKILVLHDEADQANPNIADNESAQKKSKKHKHSTTEFDLNELLSDIDPLLAKVSYAGISATIFSQLAIYGTFGAHRHGDLKTEQIISVPIPKEYKGFLTTNDVGQIHYNPSFAKPGLVYEDEQWCKSGQYVSAVKAGDGKAKNPKFVAERMFWHFNNNNPYNLTQIATVNFTLNRKGHKRTAELIHGEMNLINPGSAQFIDGTTPDIKVNNEYVVITHNGDPDATANGLSAEDKISKIYKSAEDSNIKLKGIVIVGGWLVSRAITFGTKKYDYAYCNLSFTNYGKKVDREALIQSARCSGCYSGVKEHVFYTVDEHIDAIENYANILYNDFLPALRTNGEIKKSSLYSDYVAKARVNTAGNQPKDIKYPTGINRHDVYNGATNVSASKATPTMWQNLDKSIRDMYTKLGIPMANGTKKQVIPADYVLELTQVEYNKLINDTNNNDTNLVNSFLQSKNILNVSTKLRHNNDQKNSLYKDIPLYYQGKPGVTIWQASNGTYWLYYWIGHTNGGSQYSISYNLDIDSNGKVYHLDRVDQTSDIHQPPAPNGQNGICLTTLTMPN